MTFTAITGDDLYAYALTVFLTFHIMRSFDPKSYDTNSMILAVGVCLYRPAWEMYVAVAMIWGFASLYREVVKLVR